MSRKNYILQLNYDKLNTFYKYDIKLIRYNK